MRMSDWSSDVCSSDLVFKVGLEPGVDECRDHRVEDIDDGAGGGTGIRERPVIGFVGVRPLSVEGPFPEKIGGGGFYVFGFVLGERLVGFHGDALSVGRALRCRRSAV